MATLKKLTRVGADVRQIARLLQAKAPEGHMLAYITPEEAELLKSQGGSGKPHADTGVPSFAPEYDPGGYGFNSADITDANDIGNVTAEAAPQVFTQSDVSPVSQDRFNMGAGGGSYGMQPEKSFFQPYSEGQGFQADVANRLREMPSLPTVIQAPPAQTDIDTSRPVADEGIMQRLSKATGMKEDALARLGLGGLQAVLGARTASKAAKQGQAGKAEMQAMAQPYQAKGAELQRAAQAGELTPQSQQALQAVQAQTAQQATNRGGVGTMQSQAQVEAFRQQLLAQQYDYGLKLSGIGDQIALGAIKTGMQADQYVNQLTNTYYGNIARSLYGVPPQAAQAQPVTGAP